MEKSNIVPLHRKGVKQIIDNYRPVVYLLACLLPTFDKILKEFYLIHYLNSFKEMISVVNAKLDFEQMIHACISYFQLHMMFIFLVIAGHN